MQITGLLLPVKHHHGIVDLRLLLSLLLDLALEFLLAVQSPQLGVNLLFKHALFVNAPFVNQLLLSLNGGSVVVEHLVLLPKVVVLGLKLHIKAFLHLFLPLLLTCALELLEALPHLLADLLWGLEVVVELLLVHLVLSGQQCCELGFAGFKVGRLTFTHVVNAVSYNSLFDQLCRVVFPFTASCQVCVTPDGI